MSNNKIAIVTGATGGLGKEFVKAMLQEDVEFIWAIARNEHKLATLKEELGEKILPIPLDLADWGDIKKLNERIQEDQPCIQYLVNNAGVGKMDLTENFSIEEIRNCMNVNCSAVAFLCTMAIPYMPQGGKILNISSQSAFQPNPYINLYAAGKAFVRSFTRALNVELATKQISVTAVCPGWVKTDLLLDEINNKSVKLPGLVEPEQVVVLAMKDAKAGKDMSVCTMYVKFQHVLAKLFPQKLVMKKWMKMIGDYIN